MGIEKLPNPYIGFDADDYPLDIYGWGSDAPVFEKLIQDITPNLIIEVGTWKGASAIHMAQLAQKHNLPTKIICVDTWLGALEFWRDYNDLTRFISLSLKHGYPQVYYQFLANVVKAGYQDRIIPFPQTSLIAARWFAENDVQADMIYIDASHDYEDVLADIRAYWGLVRNGGIMFGDDFDWGDVRKAVEHSDIPFTVDGRTWIMQK